MYKELRKNGFSITALPGANALVTFLSQISREDEAFSFVGFLPKSQQKIEAIATQYKYMDFVFYESPNRIIQTLEYIKNVRPNSVVAFGRELSKIFEEVKVDSISEIITYLKSNTVKGEFVCMVFREEKDFSSIDVDDSVKKLKNKGFSNKDISIILSELYGVNKNTVYNIAVGK